MNVLSLFDGISCAQIALNRAGVKYDKYFASEIDKHAIKVTQSNYPDTIQLGDISKINSQDLPKIDFICADSPCQGFSAVGKQKAFEDIRSKLFFEFVRLLQELKPKFFFLENVKMSKVNIKVINDILGVDPVLINSSLVSGQHRNRLYWSNLNIKQPEDRNIYFNKTLWRRPHGYFDEHVKFYKKSPTITTRIENDFKIVENDTKIKITPEQCEELQTVPINYTNSISKTQRFKCLGNCWTVEVVAEIFKQLKD